MFGKVTAGSWVKQNSFDRARGLSLRTDTVNFVQIIISENQAKYSMHAYYI